MKAILDRKRTFLEQTEWKDNLCRNGSLPADPLESLIDILCNFPGLLEDAEDAQLLSTSTKGDSSKSWVNLLTKCSQDLSRLAEWRSNWESRFGQCWCELDSSQFPNLPADAQGLPFQTVFYFSDIWRAYEFSIHNALRILLLRLYSRATVYAHSTEHGCQWTFHTSVQSGSLVINLAIEICRCINYFFVPEHRYLGALLFCLFPGQIALLPLDRDSELGRWLVGILKQGPKWPQQFII